MDIIIKKPEAERKTVNLGNLKPGEIFQFPGSTLDQAVSQDDGALLYMVLAEKKDGRVKFFPLSGSPRVISEKDDDRPVHKVNVRLEVWE